MSTCISQHGEYGSHEPGKGSERFLCQRCAVLDEDAMLVALAMAETDAAKYATERADHKKTVKLLTRQQRLNEEAVELAERAAGRMKAALVLCEEQRAYCSDHLLDVPSWVFSVEDVLR